MENVRIVQRLQALDDLDEDAPDVILTQVGLLFLVPSNLLEQISIVCVLHDDTIHAVRVTQLVRLI